MDTICKASRLAAAEDILEDAHFFNKLGGTSLDTMILTARLQAMISMRVMQDEFILHPTLRILTD